MRLQVFLWKSSVLFLLWFSLPLTAKAQLFQGDGKEYVLYVNPTLWLWAKEDNTTVTVRRMSDNGVLATLTLATAGQMLRQNFNVRQIRLQSDKPVFVATGVVGTGTANNDAYATYLLSENGSRIGRNFEGYTRSEILIACERDPQSTVAPQIEIIDVSDQGQADDDSAILTLAQATFSNADVVYWYRNHFDDDQIRVKANLPCAVLVGHRFRTNAAEDFSVMPPSFDPQDEGRSLGRRFFTYAHKVITIIPTQDNTTVEIKDLSDGDDSRTLTLNRKAFFTTRSPQRAYNGYTIITPNPANLIDDDFLEIKADKPIVIYVGPTTSDVNEHSIFAESVPRGDGKQEAYCFIQNGGASDFQIFAQNNQTQVIITTMAGNNNDTSILQRLGPGGGAAWNGSAAGPVWWESAAFRFEFVHIESNAPITALCGDFDQASWMSFHPFYAPNRPPRIQSTPPDRAYVGRDLDYTPTATDPDGDTLTWRFATDASGAPKAPQGASIDPATGRVTWTPNAQDAGNEIEIVIEVCDSGIPQRCTTQTIKARVELPCLIDADCASAQICVWDGKARICLTPSCNDTGLPCPPNALCREGKCNAEGCPSTPCAADELCRPSDGRCIKICVGIQCPQGNSCVDGACRASLCSGCPAGQICSLTNPSQPACAPDACQQANACQQGRLCLEGRCIDDPCKALACPAQSRCVDGQCIDLLPCQYDTACPNDDICIQGRCRPAGCYKDGCPQGQRCLEGACRPEPCSQDTCPDNGSICRPNDGRCIQLCPPCPPNQYCIDGRCQEDPCAFIDIDCGPDGMCFFGRCIPAACKATPSQFCRAQRNCTGEQCGDDLCRDLACPAGYTCIEGYCQAPPSTETPTEAPTDTASEFPNDTASEFPNDTASEFPTDTTSETPTDAASESSHESATEGSKDASEPSNDGSVNESTIQEKTIDQSGQSDSQTDQSGVISGGCGCEQASPWNSLSFMFLLFLLLQKPRRRSS